jgi:hypothetical protein
VRDVLLGDVLVLTREGGVAGRVGRHERAVAHHARVSDRLSGRTLDSLSALRALRPLWPSRPLRTARSGSTAKPAFDVRGRHRLILDVQPGDRPFFIFLPVIRADVVATAVPVSATNSASIATPIAGDTRPSRANTLLTAPPFADDLGRECDEAAGLLPTGGSGTACVATQDLTRNLIDMRRFVFLPPLKG